MDEPILSVAFGLLFVSSSIMAWTGKWRFWAKSQFSGHIVLTMLPILGLLLVSFGLDDLGEHRIAPAIGAIGILLAFPSMLFFIWTPRWFGPRWWRELEQDPRDDKQISDVVAITGPPPERHSERLARADREHVQPLSVRRVAVYDPAFGKPSASHTHGVIHGKFLLYPDEIVFVADPGDDALRPGPTILTLDPHQITAVEPPESRGERFGHTFLNVGDDIVWEIRPYRRQPLLDDLFAHYGHRRVR